MYEWLGSICSNWSAYAGLIGANFSQLVLTKLGYKDPIARGLACAGSAHGLGTAALAARYTIHQLQISSPYDVVASVIYWPDQRVEGCKLPQQSVERTGSIATLPQKHLLLGACLDAEQSLVLQQHCTCPSQPDCTRPDQCQMCFFMSA